MSKNLEKKFEKLQKTLDGLNSKMDIIKKDIDDYTAIKTKKEQKINELKSSGQTHRSAPTILGQV